jgi:hypothetical protein
MIFVGDDWAEDHHNVYATAADGAHLKFVVNGVTNIGACQGDGTTGLP